MLEQLKQIIKDIANKNEDPDAIHINYQYKMIYYWYGTVRFTISFDKFNKHIEDGVSK